MKIQPEITPITMPMVSQKPQAQSGSWEVGHSLAGAGAENEWVLPHVQEGQEGHAGQEPHVTEGDAGQAGIDGQAGAAGHLLR